MLGHYLAVLKPHQEERILLYEMMPGAFVSDNSPARCLRGVAEDACLWQKPNWTNPVSRFRDPVETFTWWRLIMPDDTKGKRHRFASSGVASRYDALCDRFGVVVVNRCIRNRVLSNQAWRLLHEPAKAYA
jgi:hypothetical protein